MEQAPVLRPLGIGDIVDRVIGLYRTRPLLFLVVSAIPYLVLAIALAALGIGFAAPLARLAVSPDPASELDPALLGVAGTFGIAFAVVAIVVFSVQSAALVHASSERYLGREVAIGEALRVGLRASLRLIGAGMLAFLAVFLAPTAVVVAAAITQQVIVVVVAAIVAVALFTFLIASWMLVPVVATIERTGPLHALRRSWTLSKGARWRVLALLTLLLILQMILALLFAFVFLGAFIADPFVRTVVQQVANLVASVVWSPIQWGTFTLLYYDLRVRREAFDLTLSAEALPRGA